MGTAPQLIGMFFLGAIQLFFIGLLGEYVLNINSRMMKRPLVVEEERLNFGDQKPIPVGEARFVSPEYLNLQPQNIEKETAPPTESDSENNESK